MILDYFADEKKTPITIKKNATRSVVNGQIVGAGGVEIYSGTDIFYKKTAKESFNRDQSQPESTHTLIVDPSTVTEEVTEKMKVYALGKEFRVIHVDDIGDLSEALIIEVALNEN